jgi:hypothetical protein
MRDLAPAVIGLLGVAIGAVVSYNAQIRILERTDNRQQKVLAISAQSKKARRPLHRASL